MNKHLKTAIFVAPVLLILGYGAADYYKESEANVERVIELESSETCDVINQQCILTSGDLEVNIFDKDQLTTVNTTFPLDRATLFLVDSDNNATPYPLGMIQTPYYWHAETNLRELAGESGQRYKLRLILYIKGGRYISEFYTMTK